MPPPQLFANVSPSPSTGHVARTIDDCTSRVVDGSGDFGERNKAAAVIEIVASNLDRQAFRSLDRPDTPTLLPPTAATNPATAVP